MPAPWVWHRLVGKSAQEAIATLDEALHKLQRALTTPEAFITLPSVANVYTPDLSRAVIRACQIVRTVALAFTVAKPIGFQPGAILTIDLVNSTAGALGAATWAPEYVFLAAYVAPAAGLRSTFTFYCTATQLIQIAKLP